MISYAFNKLKERKYILQGLIFFFLFLTIYFVLDYLNYREATIKPSTTWIVVNSFINIIMASLSMLLMNMSTIMVSLKAGGDAGTNVGFFSILFGIFTYGCTSCVVTFLAAVGISFSPTIFPFIDVWNGFLYKLLSLILLMIGLFFVLRNIKKGTCKVKKSKKNDAQFQ